MWCAHNTCKKSWANGTNWIYAFCQIKSLIHHLIWFVVEKELNVLFFPDKVEWSSFSYSFNDLVANKKKSQTGKMKIKKLFEKKFFLRRALVCALLIDFHRNNCVWCRISICSILWCNLFFSYILLFTFWLCATDYTLLLVLFRSFVWG